MSLPLTCIHDSLTTTCTQKIWSILKICDLYSDSRVWVVNELHDSLCQVMSVTCSNQLHFLVLPVVRRIRFTSEWSLKTCSLEIHLPFFIYRAEYNFRIRLILSNILYILSNDNSLVYILELSTYVFTYQYSHINIFNEV